MEELLKGILAELKSQSAQKKQPALGFKDSPRTRTIYANRQYPDCLWYFWDGSKNAHEPIESPAIAGFIEKVEIVEKEFRGKPDPKLNIHIRADKPYILESSIDTVFSRSLAFVLLNIPIEDFQDALTISVEAGEDPAVLLPKVFNKNEENIFHPYTRNTDWTSVISQLIAKFEKKDGSAKAPSVKVVEQQPKTASVKTSVERQPKTVSVKTSVAPTPEANVLTGQGLIISEAVGVADEIRSALKSAQTLRAFSTIDKKLKEHRDALGESIYEALLNNIKVSKEDRFPEEDFKAVKAQILTAKQKIGFTDAEYAEFFKENFPDSASAAELTFSEMKLLATFLNKKSVLSPADPDKFGFNLDEIAF